MGGYCQTGRDFDNISSVPIFCSKKPGCVSSLTPVSNQPAVRQPLSWLVETIGILLAAGAVFLAGVFINAFAAFVLLPIAIGFCAVRFFRHRSRCAGRTTWLALLAGNGLNLAFLLSLLFLGFESYYRFVCDRTDAMGNTLVSTAWYARYFHKNEYGFRDNVEYANALTPGKPRITFVGDSFTAGFGLKDVEDRFVNRLRRRHPEWEVHAIAKPGLDTSTEVEVMHNLTVSNGYRLDWVVLVYCINDIGEVMPGWVEGYKKMMADNFRKSWLCENSYYVNLFYHRWQLRRQSYMRNYYDEVEAAYQGPLWEIEKFGLLAFANLTKMRGGRLLVVTFPYMDVPVRFKPAHERLDRYWKEQGIPHLDLLPIFTNLPPSKLVVNPHDSHPNEYANALAAEAIDEFLKRQVADPASADGKTP